MRKLSDQQKKIFYSHKEIVPKVSAKPTKVALDRKKIDDLNFERELNKQFDSIFND